MSARSMGSGTISFGLVAIPVKLYATGESANQVRFHMVHEKCGTRVKYRYYCPTDDELVERNELVKGFEFAKDQYVLFSDEELKALTPEPTNEIAIAEFVPLEQVDPVFYEKAYYLGPDKGGARPYQLLTQAMRETGRAALAKYAARGKNYLVLLRPFEDGLIMQQLRYADEIRDFSEVPLGEAEVKKKELELALKLVKQHASKKFRPEQYEDEVRQRTWELIEKKIAGEEITAAPEEAPKAQVIDLMEALKASLGEKEAAEKKPAAKRKAAKRSGREPAAKKRSASGKKKAKAKS